MKAEYANPFIRAAVDVFEKEAGVKLSRKDLKLKNSAAPSMPVAIILGATGAVRGQVVYSMDESFAYELTKAMLPGKLPHDLKKLVNSAISELANMITGRASIELAGDHDVIHITPPAVFTGSFMSMDFLALPTITLGFLSAIGGFEVNIALTQEK
jgi:chemotaxis protein CheX